MIYAVDVNSGRLRILKETAKLHQVDGVVTTVHADLRTLTVRYIILMLYWTQLYFISYWFPFVFPRRIADHSKVTKFCWTLRALDLVFFQRWLSQISNVCSLSLFSHNYSMHFHFLVCLICFYSWAFKESRPTLEQEAGGYGTTEEITRWAPGCCIQVKP